MGMEKKTKVRQEEQYEGKKDEEEEEEGEEGKDNCETKEGWRRRT